MIPVVRKALIFGCQNSYNNNFKAKVESKTNHQLSLVHKDMDELYKFLDSTLEFEQCKILKDKKDLNNNNDSTHYPAIIKELEELLTETPRIGEEGQHHVIIIAFFGHGGKFQFYLSKKVSSFIYLNQYIINNLII